MIVNFNTLPKELLKKIPLSIRLKTDQIELAELPVEIAYILKNYVESKPIDFAIDKKVYDVVPEITMYNDFKFLTTKKQVIIEYVKNYMLVKKGSYPFDPNFGNQFYKYLQLLDKSVTQLMISNEFDELISIIQSIFGVGITFTKFNTSKVSNGVGVEYILNVSVSVENEIVNLSSII